MRGDFMKRQDIIWSIRVLNWICNFLSIEATISEKTNIIMNTLRLDKEYPNKEFAVIYNAVRELVEDEERNIFDAIRSETDAMKIVIENDAASKMYCSYFSMA